MWCPDPVPVVPETIVRQPKVGRNEPCPCDSGVKFKRCCQLRLPCGGVRRELRAAIAELEGVAAHLKDG
jgi:hypothetical protein